MWIFKDNENYKLHANFHIKIFLILGPSSSEAILRHGCGAQHGRDCPGHAGSVETRTYLPRRTIEYGNLYFFLLFYFFNK